MKYLAYVAGSMCSCERALKSYLLACWRAGGATGMDSHCLHERFQHMDRMPFSASWKKDSSGSFYFIEENG